METGHGHILLMWADNMKLLIPETPLPPPHPPRHPSNQEYAEENFPRISEYPNETHPSIVLLIIRILEAFEF